jgi:hypothetical protein
MTLVSISRLVAILISSGSLAYSAHKIRQLRDRGDDPISFIWLLMLSVPIFMFVCFVMIVGISIGEPVDPFRVRHGEYRRRRCPYEKG